MGCFEKGLIMAGPLGYIYTIFGLEASLGGPTLAGRSISLAGPDGGAQARSSLVRTTAKVMAPFSPI